MSEQRSNCAAKRVGIGYDNIKAPGDFYIADPDENPPTPESGLLYMTMWLPGEPHPLGSIPIMKGGNAAGQHWGWDGNLDRPTLTPSIHAVGHWHGWLRAGQFISV